MKKLYLLTIELNLSFRDEYGENRCQIYADRCVRFGCYADVLKFMHTLKYLHAKAKQLHSTNDDYRTMVEEKLPEEQMTDVY
jgi:hypothetical protein